MTYNQETPGIRHATDLSAIMNTFAQPHIQHLIDQMQLLTQVVLAT